MKIHILCLKDPPKYRVCFPLFVHVLSSAKCNRRWCSEHKKATLEDADENQYFYFVSALLCTGRHGRRLRRRGRGPAISAPSGRRTNRSPHMNPPPNSPGSLSRRISILKICQIWESSFVGLVLVRYIAKEHFYKNKWESIRNSQSHNACSWMLLPLLLKFRSFERSLGILTGCFRPLSSSSWNVNESHTCRPRRAVHDSLHYLDFDRKGELLFRADT